jgi:hypothetical protein
MSSSSLSSILPRHSFKSFSFFSIFFLPHNHPEFLYFSVFGTGAPTLPVPSLPEIPFCVSEGAYLSTMSIVLFFLTREKFRRLVSPSSSQWSSCRPI